MSKADLATIRQNVELESRLISDLLDLTRIAKGKMQLDLMPVNLHLLLRAAIDICQRENSARLRVELGATRHVVHGDSARLQQVFWNLISNAQKFTPADGQITVRTADVPDASGNGHRAGGDGRVRVEVSDTGEGIDPAVLPRLFTAFEQGDVGATRQFGGLGLGLAISRRLVEMHNGTIHAHSDGRNRGARFIVELPIVARTATGQWAPPGQRPLPREEGLSLKILLIEDNDATLQAIRRLLERLGHRPVVASTLAAARAAARQQAFDVVLSDLGLPDGSGLEFMKEHHHRYAGRAIALTGYGMDEDVRNSLQAGFSCHLTKPIDPDQLCDAIAQLAHGQADEAD